MSSFEPLPIVASQPDDFERKAAGRKTEQPEAQGFVPIRVGSEVEEPEEVVEPSAAEIREQAYAEGVEAGRAELPWQEVEQVRGLIETLERALASVAHLRRDYLHDQRKAMVDLALALAEKLVRSTIEADRAPLVDIIARALETLPDEGKLRVALSSEDLASLQAGFAEEIAHFGNEGRVVLEASSELACGDVRVQGERAAVDARVDSLLARIRESLEELQDIPEVQS